jgi:hypothetical protein
LYFVASRRDFMGATQKPRNEVAASIDEAADPI